MYVPRPDSLECLGDVAVVVLDPMSLVTDNQVGTRVTESLLDLCSITK